METIQKAVTNAADMVNQGLGKAASATGMAATPTATTGYGCPLGFDRMKYSLTAGPLGPVLFQNDYVLMEKSQQFTREKIPARNVHALGYGAHGTFTVTGDITKYCQAKIFSQIGKKTEVSSRLSGTFIEQGDPDTMRDVRGLAFKFYTEEGNWDLLCVNLPVFIGRDPKAGPDSVHAWKRDPRTGFYNPSQTWDYTVNYPESLHGTLMIYTDTVGTPLSFRTQNGYGANTFSFYNEKQERHWIRFHLVSELGQKGMTVEDAKLLAGEDTTFLGRDLKEAIDRGEYPRWRMCVQIMPEAQGYEKYYAFDCTKTWPHAEYPLHEIGVIELNRNPIDYFTEVEQIAFSPARVVPGIGYSPDRLLQGRLMWYDDTQFHRIGDNFKQLPINAPKKAPQTNWHVGGHMHIPIQNKFPHYWPSSYGGPQPDPSYIEPGMPTNGMGGYYPAPGEGSDQDYYVQPRAFLQALNPEMYANLCHNLALSLVQIDTMVLEKVYMHFGKIDVAFHDQVRRLVEAEASRKKTEGESVLQRMKQTVTGLPKDKEINAI